MLIVKAFYLGGIYAVKCHIRIVKMLQSCRIFLKPLDFFKVHDLFFCSLKDGCSGYSETLLLLNSLK